MSHGTFVCAVVSVGENASERLPAHARPAPRWNGGEESPILEALEVGWMGERAANVERPLRVERSERRSEPARRRAGAPPSGVGALQRSAGNRAVAAALSDPPAEAIHRAAAAGTRAPAVPYPYRRQIDRAFGRFGLGDVEAHLGPAATASAAEMHARAYTTGRHVVFARPPDLFTAAHEAAHVVQQRHGVHLLGGVGRVADVYERNADAVAARVVAGQSAESLLAAYAARVGPAASAAVQRAMGLEFECANLNIVAGAPMRKKAVMEGHDHYKATVECNAAGANVYVVEFVVDPAASTREELLGAVDAMVATAKRCDEKPLRTAEDEQIVLRHGTNFRLANETDEQLQARLAADRARIKKLAGKDHRSTKIGNYVILRSGPVEGAVQVTVGTPLEAIPAMYADFPNYGKQSIGHQRWQALAKSATVDADGQPFADLPLSTQGLLLVLMDYIVRARTDEKPKFLKALFDTMARTDFAGIFASLPKSEQDRLSEEDKDRKRTMKSTWVGWIARTATNTPTAADEKLSTAIESKSMPTLGQWLTELPSRDRFSKATLGDRGIGLGELKHRTDRDLRTDEPAPVFELRAPASASLPYTQWRGFAEQMWATYMTTVGGARIVRGDEKVTQEAPPESITSLFSGLALALQQIGPQVDEAMADEKADPPAVAVHAQPPAPAVVLPQLDSRWSFIDTHGCTCVGKITRVNPMGVHLEVVSVTPKPHAAAANPETKVGDDFKFSDEDLRRGVLRPATG